MNKNLLWLPLAALLIPTLAWAGGPSSPPSGGDLLSTNNLSDVDSASTALNNLGGAPSSSNLDNTATLTDLADVDAGVKAIGRLIQYKKDGSYEGLAPVAGQLGVGSLIQLVEDGSTNSTTVFTDSGETFTVDLTGATITNTTDGESCTATSNTASTVTCSGALSGAAQFNDGDVVTISTNIEWISSGSIYFSVLGVPYSANPTVDATGELAIDTTDGQQTWFDGTAQRTTGYKDTVCVTLENLLATDDSYTFWSSVDPVTVISGWCSCRGTCTSAATAMVDFEDSDGNKMTMTDMTCAISTSEPTAQAISGANQLVARELIAFDVVDTPNPLTDTYTICFAYTTDEQ